MSINLASIRMVATTNIREEGQSISAEDHYKKGLELYSKERIEEAVIELQLAVKFDPNNVNARLLLGAIYFNIENYENAIFYFEKILALPKAEFNAMSKKDLYLMLGFSYYKLAVKRTGVQEMEGDLLKAENYFKKVLELDPADKIAKETLHNIKELLDTISKLKKP